MKKGRILALCVVLLIVSFSVIACAGAPISDAAPAPASAPPPPTAMPDAAGSFLAAPAAPALRQRAGGDADWAVAEEMEMVAYFSMDDAYGNINFGGSDIPPPEVAAPGDVVPPTGGSAPEPPATQAHRRMIVTTFSLSAETMDFETNTAFIRSITDEFGGYIESSFEDGHSIRFDQPQARFASFTARVPSNRVHEFVAVLGEHTNIVHTNEHTTDITTTFFDSQARLASLVNQERLLVGLLDSEGADLNYILEVHRELANVRHQIEFTNTMLQQMEQSVNFSTVHVSLQEVMQYRPVYVLPLTFGERISQASSNSWNNFVRHTQNMVINAISRLPFFLLDLLIFVFWVVLFLLVRRFIRKKKGRQRGEDTFDWLPVSRLRNKAKPAPKPESDSDA